MYHIVRSVGYFIYRVAGPACNAPSLCLRKRAATMYEDDKIQRGKFITDLHSEKLSAIVSSNDETCCGYSRLICDLLLKLLGFWSFTSDV